MRFGSPLSAAAFSAPLLAAPFTRSRTITANVPVLSWDILGDQLIDLSNTAPTVAATTGLAELAARITCTAGVAPSNANLIGTLALTWWNTPTPVPGVDQPLAVDTFYTTNFGSGLGPGLFAGVQCGGPEQQDTLYVVAVKGPYVSLTLTTGDIAVSLPFTAAVTPSALRTSELPARVEWLAGYGGRMLASLGNIGVNMAPSDGLLWKADNAAGALVVGTTWVLLPPLPQATQAHLRFNNGGAGTLAVAGFVIYPSTAVASATLVGFWGSPAMAAGASYETDVAYPRQPTLLRYVVTVGNIAAATGGTIIAGNPMLV